MVKKPPGQSKLAIYAILIENIGRRFGTIYFNNGDVHYKVLIGNDIFQH